MLTMKTRHTLIGLLAIIAWLPLLIRLYAMFPVFLNTGIEMEISKMASDMRDAIAASYGSLEAYIGDQKQKNWLVWAITLVVFVGGLASGFFAREKLKGWKFVVIVMSGVFVVAYLFELFQTTGGASIGSVVDIKIALANATLKSNGQNAFIAFIVTEMLFLAAFIVHCLVVVLTAAEIRSSGP